MAKTFREYTILQTIRIAVPRILIVGSLAALLFGCVALPVASAARPPVRRTKSATIPFTEAELIAHVEKLATLYFADFRHAETHVLYGARLSTKDRWTTPTDIKKEKPHPWGYGSRIADTSLHCGHVLVALLDANEARPDPFLQQNIRRTFDALKLIGSLPETHPKSGKPALIGLVPRGPHPDDLSAWYDDSSMDQHTTYIISLARFANSQLATKAEKAWIRQSLEKVGRRLEQHGWSIKRADGVTQAHVGFAWTGYISQHVSILLPTVYALYKGTGNKHWLDVFNSFVTEKDGLRWQRLHPGPHIALNGHPIYANQGSFRVNALHKLQTDAEKKAVLHDLLSYVANLQMRRDFPGPMYRKFHSTEEWQRLRAKWNWSDEELHGSAEAWNKFNPKMLDGDALAVLAHVRFPLTGYHMALMSENPQLIREHLPAIWKMLTTIDLKKISAGETNYLYTVLGLHIYAFYFQQQNATTAIGSDRPGSAPDGARGKQVALPIVANAGIGPTIDVTVSGDYAYTIGRGVLRVMDISKPRTPKVLGTLTKLGNTRQLAVHDGIAYVGSREDGVFIVDVRNPVEPTLLAHYDSIEFATGICVSGNVLFIACRHYGVELVDISTPTRPLHLSTVRTGEAQSVTARDGILYAGVWGTSEVVVVNVENPRNPQVVAKVPLDGYGDGLVVSGKFLYAASGHHSREKHRQIGDPGFGHGHGLEIFDLSNPEKPLFVSRVKFPPFYEIGNDLWDVKVVGNVAFVADTHNGVFAVDVEDPLRPRVIGRCQLPEVKGRKLRSYVGGLALIKDHILVAGGWSDLHVVEAAGISDVPVKEPNTPPTIHPALPFADQPNATVYRSRGQIHAVDFLGDRAIVACGSDGVHVVQLRPKIRKAASLLIEGFATDVSVQGSDIFVAEGNGGLTIHRLSDDGSWVRLARFRSKKGLIRQVEVPNSQIAMIQSGANTLQFLDVSDRTAPKLILTENRMGLLYGDQMMRGLIADRYAAAFWHVSGIHWYDLEAGEKQTASFSGDVHPERFGASNGLVAFGTKTLVTTRGGYLLLDRRERRPFRELPIRRVGNRRQHLGKPTVFGDRLYASNRSTGIVSIIDIADPEKPQLIKQIETPGNPGRIVIHDGMTVIPDGYNGLLLFDDK